MCRTGFRRHYNNKSLEDSCLVMAKALGWTGEFIYEEEMFRVQPTHTS